MKKYTSYEKYWSFAQVITCSTTQCLVAIYKSFIRPHLGYGDVI